LRQRFAQASRIIRRLLFSATFLFEAFRRLPQHVGGYLTHR
jgi:hypothetical protein